MTSDERQEVFETLARIATSALARDEGKHEVAEAIVGAAAAALVQLVGAKAASGQLSRFAAQLRALASEEQKLRLDKQRPGYAIALAIEALDQGANRRFRH